MQEAHETVALTNHAMTLIEDQHRQILALQAELAQQRTVNQLEALRQLPPEYCRHA